MDVNIGIDIGGIKAIIIISNNTLRFLKNYKFQQEKILQLIY